MNVFYQTQNRWLQEWLSYRTEPLDWFFQCLNFFDTQIFYFMLVPAIWYGISRKWGITIFFFFVITILTNTLLKEWLMQPRPEVLIPNIALIPLKSYGFPSGGAQNSLIIGGLFIWALRTRLAWVLGSLYAFLISLSRIYLGVHYFSDVIGGWLIGAALLWLFIRYHRDVERKISKIRPNVLLASVLVIPLSIALLFSFPKVLLLMSSCAGIGIGLYLDKSKAKLDENSIFLIKAARITVAYIGGMLLFFLFTLSDLTIYEKNIYMPFFFSLWLVLGTSFFCRQLEKAASKVRQE
jgi:membrane-associated phospholipid phosphatase